MDGILDLLNAFRQSELYSLALPYARAFVLFSLGACIGSILAVAVEVEDLLAAVRQTLRDLNITDQEAAHLLGVNPSNLYDKLRGDRALTLAALAKFGSDFFQAFPVRLAMRYGSPQHVVVGARLAREARRQARMSLPHSQKAGIA